jgi:hypothetical protein
MGLGGRALPFLRPLLASERVARRNFMPITARLGMV